MSHTLSPGHHLSLLESARLIRRLAAEPELAYFFRHTLIQEAAYASLLKSDRRLLHRAVAETLEDIYASNLEQWYGMLAYHYQQAEIPDKAREYLFKAGEQARARYANADAISFYTEALALTPGADVEARYTIVLARERVYDVLGAREAQWRDLEALAALLETLPTDVGRRAALLLRQGDYAERTGDYAQAATLARQAIALAQTANLAAVEAQGHFQWGVALWRKTHYDAARSPLEQARTMAQKLNLPALESDSVRLLGVLADSQSDYAAAHVHFREALRLKRAIGDRRGEGQALNSLGIVAYHQSDYAEAQRYFEGSLRLKRELGDRSGEISTLHNLSNVLVQLGYLTEAQAYYTQALHACRETRDPDGEASALGGLATSALLLGQYIAARSYFEQALALFQEVGDREGEAEILVGLASLAHLTHDDETALAYAQRAQALAEELSNEYIQSYALTAGGQALLGLRRLTAAAQAYTRAIQFRREMDQANLVTESLAGLTRVRLAEGENAPALALAEEILMHLAEHSLDGTDDPASIYLACYHALHANADPRAQPVLVAGQRALRERAAKISDNALRRSFLENVSSHRELLALFVEGN